MNVKHMVCGAIAGLLGLLPGCGGGGGGGDNSPPPAAAAGPVASTASFALPLGIANTVNNSLSFQYDASGTVAGNAVTGSGTETIGAPSAVTFEGHVTLAKVTTDTGTVIVNGVSTPYAGSITSYWSSSSYQLLGRNLGTEYWVSTSTTPYASTVRINDTGNIATLNRYTNSSKTVLLGTATYAYVVEPDTATTAVLNVIGTKFSGTTVQETSQVRYRIDSFGSVLKVVSLSVTNSNGSITYTVR